MMSVFLLVLKLNLAILSCTKASFSYPCSPGFLTALRVTFDIWVMALAIISLGCPMLGHGADKKHVAIMLVGHYQTP